MEQKKQRARQLLKDFKGDRYVCGLGCLDQLGALVAGLGTKAAG